MACEQGWALTMYSLADCPTTSDSYAMAINSVTTPNDQYTAIMYGAARMVAFVNLHSEQSLAEMRNL